MIDPLKRWADLGEKPDYAGLLSFGGAPYTEDAADLEGADVAIVGAPMDDLVSDRPGTRFAPRAIRAAGCPPGPHLEAGVDALGELKVVDYGDAAVTPADAVRSHAAIEAAVGEVLGAGAIPVVLGGDHSVTEPAIRACAAVHGPVGVVHFDTHTDTAATVFGAELSHGTFMRRLLEAGHVTGERYAQIGLRGYWPGEEDFAWQRERGITSLFMHDVRELGIRETVGRAVAAVGDGPVYLTVDVDVLDPAFVPGTGTPEPGGMTAVDLLLAVRTVATELEIVGLDVVEVIPSASAAPTTPRSWRTGSCARASRGSPRADEADRPRCCSAARQACTVRAGSPPSSTRIASERPNRCSWPHFGQWMDTSVVSSRDGHVPAVMRVTSGSPVSVQANIVRITSTSPRSGTRRTLPAAPAAADVQRANDPARRSATWTIPRRGGVAPPRRYSTSAVRRAVTVVAWTPKWTSACAGS